MGLSNQLSYGKACLVVVIHYAEAAGAFLGQDHNRHGAVFNQLPVFRGDGDGAEQNSIYIQAH